ncbi:MAG: transcriptional regulator [Caldilineaceae bacterium]|nr:transcriptional regulator [Caldilineaceae bacterium]
MTGQPNGQTKTQRKWYRVDLHLHSPASRDYEEPKTTYLEWLQTAADKDLDIVAMTDHNTVAGIAAIRKEIEWLVSLDQAGRLTADEKSRLARWRELSDRVLVLPGFEFTATFGFHILALFPPETTVRQLEHTLLMLSIPDDKLDAGSTETGASTDVLTAYQIIHDAGGLVIAAHANSTHGVAMRNFPFGGQTKIAYTQDLNLDALEVTDLDRHSRSTARFFNGSKAEYARRMHCIQGSDAHRLVMDERNPKRLGIGDRATEMLLDAPTFESISSLLRSKQFDRTRPMRPKDKPFDPLAVARDEGPSIVLSFHETASQRGGRLATILNDVCAFANTMGGTVYVGASQRKGAPKGLPQPLQTQKQIQEALDARITPPLSVKFDVVQSENANVLRLQVPKGADRPYCIDDYKFFVRDESETSMAVRDEIIALVKDVLADEPQTSVSEGDTTRNSGQSNGHQRSSRNRRSSRSTSSTTSKPEPTSMRNADDAFYCRRSASTNR